MKKPMYLVDDLKYACRKLSENTSEKFEESFKNLISHAFVRIEKELVEFCKEKGKEYKNFLFYGIQDLLISFMYADCSLLQQEYDAYCKFCEWAKVEPATPDNVKRRASQITKDDLICTINLIRESRDFIDPGEYNAFVVALEFFCLMGDKELDENEYYLISCFYEDGFDVAPKNWKKLQKERKKGNW